MHWLARRYLYSRAHSSCGPGDQESSNGCSIPSFVLPRSAIPFRHENNNYISRRVVRFRCLRARAGCHKGDRDFGAEIREPGYWHGHIHKDWRRSARHCGLPKPQTGQTRFPYTRERRLLGAGCDVSRPAFQSEASTPRRADGDGTPHRRFRQC